jgi:hypothetical protein
VKAAPPVVARAQRRMRAAAALYDRAAGELHAALAELEAHPDFAEAVRREAAGRARRWNLVWWAHECILSAARDAPPIDAGDWLRDDVETMPETLAAVLLDEERTTAAFRRRA